MRDIVVVPSLLSADFGNLGADIKAAEECGMSALHCDIMDGHFVPNITFGPMIVRAVRSLTELRLRVHLMIEQPERFIDDFVDAGANEITVHAETCPHLHRTIQHIQGTGDAGGVALNPSTPLCDIENVINDIDLLLIMTVNPGFGGQTFIEAMVPKITRARAMADDAGADIDIAVDGGIDTETVGRIVQGGSQCDYRGFQHIRRKAACDAGLPGADRGRAGRRRREGEPNACGCAVDSPGGDHHSRVGVSGRVDQMAGAGQRDQPQAQDLTNQPRAADGNPIRHGLVRTELYEWQDPSPRNWSTGPSA